MTRKRGQTAFRLALLGTTTVSSLFLLTTALQRAESHASIVKFGGLIGIGIIAGLFLCLVSLVMGLLGVRTSDRYEQRNSLFAIGISLVVLVAFAIYTYMGMQSPNFGPVH